MHSYVRNQPKTFIFSTVKSHGQHCKWTRSAVSDLCTGQEIYEAVESAMQPDQLQVRRTTNSIMINTLKKRKHTD